MTIKFTDDQQRAIDAFVAFLSNDEKYLIIQGAAGCGKSTLIKYLAKQISAYHQMKATLLKNPADYFEPEYFFCATTNPAADVLSELTNLPTQTIHSLLGLKTQDDYKTGKVNLVLRKTAEPVNDSLIIIDEASMIGPQLFQYIEDRTPRSKIVLIGDQYQLAPVGAVGCYMEHLNCVKVSMNKIMRHNNSIAKAGAQYRKTVKTGKFESFPKNQSDLLQVDGPTFQKLVDDAFIDKNYSEKSARILAWTNNRVLQYNSYIRELKKYPNSIQVGEVVYTNKPILTPQYSKSVDATVTVTGAGTEFIYPNTTVKGRQIELGGCYSAFLPNEQNDARNFLNKLARDKNWGEFFRLKNDWLDLRYPYASTVHKAQGSNYDTVFIDLFDIGKNNHYREVARLLYVAITRATKQVICYGELPACYAG